METHRPESLLLPARQFMLWMVLQAWVKHLFDSFVTSQETSHRTPVFIMLLHPNSKCLHPTQEQIALKRRQIPPVHFCTNLNRSACSSVVQTRTPPRPSEWPFKNFVVECITISAPSEIGC